MTKPNALSLQTDLPAQPREELEDASLAMRDPHTPLRLAAR